MIAILIKSLISVGTRLLVAMGSEILIEWAFFKVAETLAANTKTKHDDEFVDMLKRMYKDPKDATTANPAPAKE